MQETKQEPDISFAKSTPDSSHSCQSWRSPIESHCQESALSNNSALKMGVPAQRYHNAKLLDLSFQDQDSCSTQSTGQSYPRATSFGENNINSQSMVFTQPGYYVTHAKHEGGDNKFSSLIGSQNYSLPHLQADCNQYSSQLAVPFSDQFFNGVLTTYGPQAVMMGVMPARVPLPLDIATSEPIYVNPKQYHGILRRRQHRAKLEAQNKLGKNRKPYLHESRHQHALKRARGSGGRFLNSQKLQESKPASTADGQAFSRPVLRHSTGNRFESEVYQQQKHVEGTSTSCSDVTSTSTSDDIYHPVEFSFSSYSSRVGGTMQGRGGGKTIFQENRHS